METVKTGSKIGRLTVEESTKQRRNGYVVWKCRCQCGREILADSRTLRRGSVKDCGCSGLRPGQRDITGRRFGMLTALRPTEERTGRGSTVWQCRCDCGKEITADVSRLISGSRKSCGCLRHPPLKDFAGKRYSLSNGSAG